MSDEKNIEPLWCATANIKKETIFGEEHIVRKGTKHFRVGQKFILLTLMVECVIMQLSSDIIEVIVGL